MLANHPQDILREKQNHIEQLLLERELEKQDSESQIISYQKDINQVCTTCTWGNVVCVVCAVCIGCRVSCDFVGVVMFACMFCTL